MRSSLHVTDADARKVCLLSDSEQALRLSRIKKLMAESGIDSCLLSDYANIYYLSGRVFAGYIYVTSGCDRPVYFLRRPIGFEGDNVFKIHKLEDIPPLISDNPLLPTPGILGLENSLISYSDIMRIRKAFGLPSDSYRDISGVMRQTRAVKTALQIEMLRESGEKHSRIYREIPRYYRPGMTDIELQIEIERALRLGGNLGQFRISGTSMEVFMGALLAGKNADSPSPYDFALGGAGLDPSLPVGADGAIIRPGTTVLVDLGGDFNGYMTDMSRVFSLGDIPQKAHKAHSLSIDIHREIVRTARPGTEARILYDIAKDMADKAGMTEYFMGHRQHAGFIGHGVGIEINELPVLAPRSKDILQVGNVIALEPKFVIPEVGAVGIENTYYMSEDGNLVNLTPAPEEIISLGQ